MGEKREEWYYLSTSIEKRKEKGTRESRSELECVAVATRGTRKSMEDPQSVP